MHFDRKRKVTGESGVSYVSRIDSGFMHRYLAGSSIIEVGGTGAGDGVPIVQSAINVDVDYPGYDGIHLPFPDLSQDAVYASHVLEHVPDVVAALREWFRVLKVGGFMVIMVPHQLLYEKKKAPPSRFAGFAHKRFFMPHSLIADITRALPLTEWRLRHMRDNDDGFDYDLPPEMHWTGCYEIECVIERINRYKFYEKLISV